MTARHDDRYGNCTQGLPRLRISLCETKTKEEEEKERKEKNKNKTKNKKGKKGKLPALDTIHRKEPLANNTKYLQITYSSFNNFGLRTIPFSFVGRGSHLL